MRILVYGLNYAPEPVGTGKYTAEMAAWLARRGHYVEAIAAPPHYPQWRLQDSYRGHRFVVEELNGVRVYRAPLYVPPDGQVNTTRRILLETTYSLAAARWWLPRFIAWRSYDVVIAVCPPLQVGVYPWLYGRVRGVPWIFHIQDLQVDAAVRLGMMQAGPLERVLYQAENFLLSRATRVSTITEPMMRRVAAKGAPPERIWFFPNWADTEFVRPLPRLNPVRAVLGVEPEDVLVLYSGNMGEKQGLGLILDVASGLQDHKEIKFVLAGAGAARRRLEEIARSRSLANLTFHDLFPWEEMPQVLAAGDIHLVVQRRESADLVMPSKLTNILAAGRASVATADPGTALYEVLTGREAGLVVPPGDVAALTEAIRSLAGDQAKREMMGRKARRYAEQYLAKDAVLGRFEEQLIHLISAHRAAQKRG